MAVNALNVAKLRFRPKLVFQQLRETSRWSLGCRPEKGRKLSERLQELVTEDPQVHYKVDIGFALKKVSRKETVSSHVKLLKENHCNKELELLSREQKLLIPLDKLEEDAGPLPAIQAKAVAEHYAIYQHLFVDAFFHPVVDVQIRYSNETVPVYRGNVVKPSEAIKAPEVSFKSRPDDLWTLVMTTPDGTANQVERIHWIVGNIEGGDVAKGEELCHYIQPLPFQGLGYLRYIFVLYKQESRVDYSELAKKLESTRFFSTRDFYAKRQDVLTPAGLAFFTSDWDETVRDYYHNVLKEEPPIFEYDFPEHYYKPQTWFPLREAFNLYLDRYRDQKEIAKEMLVKKLKMTDPFKGDLRPKYPFPNAVPFDKDSPSWLNTEIKKERLKLARHAVDN